MTTLRALTTSLVLCLCLSALQGCATPYQSARGSFTGGFGEKRINDSAYWVYFAGNGYARRDRVLAFWLNRCAELTIQQGFQYMVLHPGENAPVGLLDAPVKPAAYAAGSSAAGARPAVYYQGSAPQLIPVRGSSGGYVTTTTIYGGGMAKWNSKGTVLMYHAPLAEELVWAYDAQKVLDILKEYVASNGAIPAPSLDKVAQDSVVAHEQVSFELSAPTVGATSSMDLPIAVSPSDGAEGTAPAKAQRGDAEIADWFDSHSVVFHALFRERVRIEHRMDAGTVSLSFSVTPNGNAINCQVVSTSFPDRNFAEAVALDVCRMTFTPRDVVQTDVPPLTITFVPLDPAATF